MTLNTITKIILMSLLLHISTSFTLTAKDVNVLAYVDRGIKYYPKYVKRGVVKYGKASWYGKPFHGRLTANGERYNMYNMTAAHRTYAMNTILKVTNLSNKRSVRVRVNDRGPFYSSRAIDLSYGAAKRLGIVQKGIGKIKIEVLSSGGKKKYSKYRKIKIKKRKKKRVYTKAIASKKRLKKTKIVKKRKFRTRKLKKIRFIKKRAVKKRTIKKKKVFVKKMRTEKVQLASFSNKKSASLFAKKHRLKNVLIVKKHLKSHKKDTYAVMIRCNEKEAKKLLKSKKFLGAFKIS